MTKRLTYILAIISAILTLSECAQKTPDLNTAPDSLKDFIANINNSGTNINTNININININSNESSEDSVIVETVTKDETSPEVDNTSKSTTDYMGDCFSAKASDVWKIDYSDNFSCSYAYAEPETDEEYSVFVTFFCTLQGGSEYISLDEYVDMVKEINDTDYKMISETESTFAGYKNKELLYMLYEETQLFARLMHVQTEENLYSITIIYQNEEPAKHIQLSIDRLLEGLSIT